MATKTTPESPRAWRPDLTEYLPSDAVPDALILSHATVVGKIEGDAPSVRVPKILSDGDANFTAEGSTVADAGQEFGETVVQTHKAGALGKYSYETLQQPEAAELILASLRRNLTGRIDRAFVGGESSDGPTGLLNADVTDGGQIGDNLDKLVDAVSGIEAAGGSPTGIIASPASWATLSKLKTGKDQQVSLLGSGTDAGERQLLSIPVQVSAAMPENRLLVVDKTAVVAASSGVRLARSEDAYFSSDVVAIRVTWRAGWSVMHTDRVARLSTGSGSGSGKK